MKFLLSSLTLSFCFLNAAHATSLASCPSGTTASFQCVSKPTAGDNKIVSQMFEAISICKEGENTLLALKAEGQTESAEVSKIEQRTGGVTYIVSQDGEEFLEFSVGLGNPSVRSNKAMLTMFLYGDRVSSTYACVRQK